MNIDEMPVGCEMDALIAVKVMGLKDVMTNYSGMWEHNVQYEQFSQREEVPQYSSSISAAWDVVEKMDLLDIYVGYKLYSKDGVWYVEEHFSRGGYPNLSPRKITNADTAPLAICRAALKAVEGREGG